MRKAITAGTILVAAWATGAAAQCSQASLTGSYVYFGIEAIKPPGGSVIADSSVERCLLQIDGTGTIVEVAGDPICPTLFPGGTFAIDSQCAIELTTAFCQYSGQLSVDRLLIAGTSGCSFDNFDRDIYFNFVRATRDVFESAAASVSAPQGSSLSAWRWAPPQATEPYPRSNASGR